VRRRVLCRKVRVSHNLANLRKGGNETRPVVSADNPTAGGECQRFQHTRVGSALRDVGRIFRKAEREESR
jgi:hypothetical protein